MIRSIVAACALGLALSVSTAQAAIVSLAASLTPDQETGGSTSTGSGTAAMSLDTIEREFFWSINHTGLEGDVTLAHFHKGAVGVSGPPVFNLIPDDRSIASNNDTGPNGSLSGYGVLTADEITDVLAGLWYVNLHTAANPAGAIRGQVLRAQEGTFNPVPLPAAAWLLLSALGGLGLARRRSAARQA